ncbi:MAG: hypothetical protein NWE91_01995 [Candidatus Bathyarchaeota archaeon]|nr:hypothetical protein [Candidatus Bathyarchaeota archaeon]
MHYETIEDFGDLGIEFFDVRGLGSRTAKAFLRDLLKQFVLRSAKYYNETGEYAFYYRERQLHSIICPSIAQMPKSVFLMEHPIDRKPAGEIEYRGSADYWISYRNYSFIMELKHAYFAFSRAHSPSKRIAKKLADAWKQLQNVRMEQCRKLKFGDGLRKIALEVITFYRRQKNEANLEDDLDKYDFKRLFKELIENAHFKYEPDFHGLWVLDRELIEPIGIESLNSFEIFPAVAFIGYISKIIK